MREGVGRPSCLQKISIGKAYKRKFTFLSLLLSALLIGNTPLVYGEEILVISKQAPPFFYEENNKIKGLIFEIVSELSSRTGIPFKAMIFPWARAYNMGLSEKHILIPTLIRTGEREKLFKWVGETLRMKFFFYKLASREDIKITSLDDAKKYRIGVMNEEVSHQYLKEEGFNSLDIVNSGELNIKKLLAKDRIDLIVFEENVFDHKIKKMDISASLFEKSFNIKGLSKEISMAFSIHTDDAIVKKYVDAYDQIIKDGTYDRIINRFAN